MSMRICNPIVFALIACCFAATAHSQPQPKPPDWVHNCSTAGSNGAVCEFPRTVSFPVVFDFSCDDGTKLREHRFVCLSGLKTGQAFDVWCRAAGTKPDGKCNLTPLNACPNTPGLTQWTVSDHCTHANPGDATGNWKVPDGWVVPPLK